MERPLAGGTELLTSTFSFLWKGSSLLIYQSWPQLGSCEKTLLLLLTAKSLQSCPTLCDPVDGSPPGSPIPGILQARTLEWVTISFSNAWKWKVKWSCSVVSDSYRPRELQPTRLLCSWDFPGKSTGVGCHCLLGENSSEHNRNSPLPFPPVNRLEDYNLRNGNISLGS